MRALLHNRRAWRLLLLCLSLLAALPHAEATDYVGAPSASHPLPGEDLFIPGFIPRITISLAPKALARLREHPREFVSAQLSEASNTFQAVAVHLKGSVGSFRPVDDKPCFTLDFTRLSPDGPRFHGLRRIHLNNSVEDSSFANEKLGSELFLAAGVPAPRVTRARVSLNGRDLGLYVLKEAFTEDFLSCHFVHVGCGLYEPERGHDLDQTLKRNTIDGLPENDQILRSLAVAAAQADNARRWELISPMLDTNRFLTLMALEVMLSHRDGYCLARNNFRVYHDLDSKRMILLPHGMDQLLGTPDLSWHPSLSGLAAMAAMASPAAREAYEAQFRSLFIQLFRLETLTNRLNLFAQELRPVLSSDEWRSVNTETDLLADRLRQRHASLRQQFEQPELRPLAFTNGTASLNAWNISEAPGSGRIDRATNASGAALLHIAAAGETLATWRARALLSPGRYRFIGRSHVSGVVPLSFGQSQGAGLRIGGRTQRSAALAGDCDWRLLTTDFEVSQLETIEFICELRASAGEAWFEAGSLQVTQISSYENR
jgi:hypothetical protein